MDGSASKSTAVARNQPSDVSVHPESGVLDTVPISTDDAVATTGPVSAGDPVRTDEPAGRGSSRIEPVRGEPSYPESLRADPAPPAPPAPVGRGPDRGRGGGLPRSLVAALVVAVLAISAAVALNLTTGALDRLNPFRNGLVQQRTVDRSGPAVLKAITDLGDFRAASGYYELVVDIEKDVKPVPSFLAGERVLFIAAGTVEVGVDLRGLGTGAVTVDGDRTGATLTLPRPTLGAPKVDVQRSYIYSRQRGLVDRFKDAVGNGSTDQQALYELASKRLAEAAAKSDELTTRAETNTRSMLEGLLRSLGFTDVTITFAA
jgi:uncharacterized protein DUF4230